MFCPAVLCCAVLCGIFRSLCHVLSCRALLCCALLCCVILSVFYTLLYFIITFCHGPDALACKARPSSLFSSLHIHLYPLPFSLDLHPYLNFKITVHYTVMYYNKLFVALLYKNQKNIQYHSVVSCRLAYKSTAKQSLVNCRMVHGEEKYCVPPMVHCAAQCLVVQSLRVAWCGVAKAVC